MVIHIIHCVINKLPMDPDCFSIYKELSEYTVAPFVILLLNKHAV